MVRRLGCWFVTYITWASNAKSTTSAQPARKSNRDEEPSDEDDYQQPVAGAATDVTAHQQDDDVDERGESLEADSSALLSLGTPFMLVGAFGAAVPAQGATSSGTQLSLLVDALDRSARQPSDGGENKVQAEPAVGDAADDAVDAIDEQLSAKFVAVADSDKTVETVTLPFKFQSVGEVWWE